MSDAKVRDLERRWKETGNIEDEAAYLLERVRMGDLSREKLELAAYCGHEGARRVAPYAVERDSSQWIAGLARWPRCLAEGAHALACATLDAQTAPKDRLRLLEALRLIREALDDPSQANQTHLWRIPQSLGRRTARDPLTASECVNVIAAAWCAAWQLSGARFYEPISEFRCAVAVASERLGQDTVRVILARAVLAWCGL